MAPDTSSFAFVPLSAEWITPCAEIATHAPDPWSAADLQQVLQNPHHRCFVALEGVQAVGFASFFTVAETADLQLVAVHPLHRRQGMAQQLLRHSLGQLAAEAGVQRCLLELRAGNQPAFALYTGLGFTTLARRPGMYTNPPEDGLLMALPLGG